MRLNQFKAISSKHWLTRYESGFWPLGRGEVGMNDLCVRLDAEQSTLSQQLAVLRNRSIVVGRKDGQSVFYSVRDPEINKLLDVAKKIFNNHLIDLKDLLSQLVVPSASRG